MAGAKVTKVPKIKRTGPRAAAIPAITIINFFVVGLNSENFCNKPLAKDTNFVNIGKITCPNLADNSFNDS